MIHRRSFLRTSACAVGAAAVSSIAWGCGSETQPEVDEGSAAARDTTQAGAAPGASLQTIGVQLYTVRGLMDEDAGTTLQQIAEIGYGTVETAGFAGMTPDEFKALLDQHGLRSPSGHYMIEQMENDLDGVIAAAQAVGQSYVVCPYLAEERRQSLDDYRGLADQLNTFGERLQEAGLQLAYHNHDFEFETFGGDTPAYDILLENTDPELVAVEMDLYWVSKAGYEPSTYFERYPDRLALFHLKDITGEGDIAPVGQGTLDFQRLITEGQSAGLQHAFVEHDNPDDPIASIRSSYQYLTAS